MQLNLTNGYIGPDYPKSFFRVAKWGSDRYVADFTTQIEAEKFAISNARATGERYDHKVSKMNMVTA